MSMLYFRNKPIGAISSSSGNAIGYEETVGTACKNPNGYTVGSYFKGSDGNFYEVTAAISSGDTITVGTNCEQTDIATELSELNSKIVNAGTVRYYNGEIQYTADGGTTWADLIHVSPSVQLLPVMSSNAHALGVASADSGYPSQYPPSNAYKVIDGTDTSYFMELSSTDKYVAFEFTDPTYVEQIRVKTKVRSDYAGTTVDFTLDYSTDGISWQYGANKQTSSATYASYSQSVQQVIKAIRVRKAVHVGALDVNSLEAWG